MAKPVRFTPKPAEMRRWAKQADTVRTFTTIRNLCLADIRREAKAVAPKRVSRKARYLYEIAPVDLHVGKYAWSEETGTDYDIRIAEQVFTDGVEDLLARADHLPLEQIALVVGNDLLQTDTTQGTTTSGTYVDTDSRIVKSFRRARAINSWAIRQCAKIAPVKVLVVPGNHDELMAFCVGEVLAAEFSRDARVTFDVSPRPRKYLRYGPALLGWTHGHEVKPQDLPLIMAHERKKDWAATSHHEFHTGHLHKAKEMRFTAGDSFNGVRVRILPALCAADAWHTHMGFIGEQRACEAYLWDKTRGYAGHFSTNAK